LWVHRNIITAEKRWTKPSSSPRHRHDHQQGLKTIIKLIS
jgi:hypothetical protein